MNSVVVDRCSCGCSGCWSVVVVPPLSPRMSCEGQNAGQFFGRPFSLLQTRMKIWEGTPLITRMGSGGKMGNNPTLARQGKRSQTNCEAFPPSPSLDAHPRALSCSEGCLRIYSQNIRPGPTGNRLGHKTTAKFCLGVFTSLI